MSETANYLDPARKELNGLGINVDNIQECDVFSELGGTGNGFWDVEDAMVREM